MWHGCRVNHQEITNLRTFVSHATQPSKPAETDRLRRLEIPLFLRLARLVLLIVILFVSVRTLIIEPFGVPTGSMAEVMLGNHRERPCPRCGFPVVVGDQPGAERRNPFSHAACSNCGRRDLDLRSEVDLPGDRLLVDKVVYSIRKPRRWELAVFRCPVDDSTPYVKRVVGLPGESIEILGGDVFIQGDIVRKSWETFVSMRVPVFDARYEPSQTWASRWAIGPETPPVGLPRVRPPALEKSIAEGTWCDNTLTLKSAERETIRFVNRNLETKHEELYRDSLTYNAGVGVGQTETVHDFAVSFGLVRHSGALTVTLTDGLDAAAVRFDGTSVSIDRGGGYPLIEKPLSLAAQVSKSVEIGLIDRTIHVRIDGQSLAEPIEWPADPTSHGRRSGVSSPVRFTVAEGHWQVSKFRIDRDVHYRRNGRNAVDAPLKLGADDYFVLGDNSANSRDSRVWTIPAVAGRDFIGKPIVIHQAMRARHVAWNGQERSYPTLDWSRLRWIR